MTMQSPRLMPAMRELNCSNDLLDDHAALAAAWDRDGYWFFRDVLDKKVIADIREVYAAYLRDMGVVDPDAPDLCYNGADYGAMPINSNLTKLNEDRVHRLLHDAPNINAFFTRLFGCDPFWVPFTVHRTNPPVRDRAKSRFDFIHEDGIYNDGLDFLICWVPIDEIDADTGGLALIEGVHNGPCLHRKDGMKISPIQLEDVPQNTWRRSDYRPGDVLLMSLRTPHSGLSNISKNRFRLSMDTRIMPSNGRVPLAGSLSQVSASGLTIDTAAGPRSLILDSASFVRGHHGDQMTMADVPNRYHIGDHVIIAADGDRVVNMRPQH